MTDSAERFGRYELRGVLGSGGFATVFRARDPLLGREVALKALAPHLGAEPEDRARFLAEARALAGLHHPNIVAVYDVGEAPHRPFFTMQLVEGETLAAFMAQRGRLSLEEALPLLEQLAEALDYVHRAGLVHRDVKPENVMLEQSAALPAAPHVLLMDFGVVLSRQGERLTRRGVGLGTPAYVAPEQIAGEGIGPAADIYALGVLTYELLAGAPPFTGDTAHVLYAQAHLAPPPLTEVRPELPAGVSATVAAALSKDPRARPASAGAFVAALRRAMRAPAPAGSRGRGGQERGGAPAARIAGHGDATRTLDLPPGVRCFQLSHRVWGGRPFRVTLLNAAGGAPDLLVATTGPYSGIAWRRIDEGGSYTLRIEAAGDWAIGVR